MVDSTSVLVHQCQCWLCNMVCRALTDGYVAKASSDSVRPFFRHVCLLLTLFLCFTKIRIVGCKLGQLRPK